MTQPRDARGAHTLEAKYFTSPDIFQRELTTLFRRRWLAVARASDAPRPGAVKRVEILGESYLLTRDQRHQIHCLANVCRHRGTQICAAERIDDARALTCPYHGWTYGLDGALRAAPNMHDTPRFDVGDWPLHQATTCVWQGFVMAALDVATEPVRHHDVLSPRLDAWEIDSLRAAQSLTYDVRANWKLIVQNFNECYHCPRVHPRLNRNTSYKSAANDHDEGPVLGGPMRLNEGVSSMTEDGSACARTLPGLDAELARQVYYYSIFPNLFVSPHPDFVLVHRLEPLSVSRTLVRCEFLFEPAAIEAPGFDAGPAVRFWDQVNREDWEVCEWSQRGVESSAYRPGPYSNLESNLAAFDRYYLAALDGAR